jgi:RNA polymerase sigma factor (sigma-70 family)
MANEQQLSELVQHIMNGDLDKSGMNAVFSKFYKKVYPKLYSYCRYSCLSQEFTANDEDIEDLLYESLVKFYESAKSFKIEKFEFDNEKILFDRVMWRLMRIAKNLFTDKIRWYIRRKEFVDVVEIQTLYKYSCEPFADTEKEIDLSVILKALEILTEREKDVLLTYSKFVGGNVPTHILENICKQYGITKDYIRQIKGRSFKKVKKYLLKGVSKAKK